MIVLILFTICQFTLLIMNHMLFQGIPSAWNQIGIPVVAISFFTEAVLVINSYRNSKNKVLEQKKERLEHELNRMKMEEESAEVQAERLNKRREDLLRIVNRRPGICGGKASEGDREEPSRTVLLQYDLKCTS